MPTIDEALQIGWKQHQAGDVRGAENIYRQVLAVAPANENAWCFLGMACHDQQRYDEAVEAYRQALQIKSRFPVALSNLGNTLKQLGRLDEAEASCREALRYKPDYSTAFNNLGVVQVAQGRLTDASATFEKALQLMPNDAVAHANLGAALVRQGRFDEGTANAERALRINPHYAEAHKNQAIVALLLGDFARGWPEYEWRWRCPASGLPAIPQSRWSGEPLAGRTLLLHWEQGLGDTIQFVRYARILKAKGARIIVCCQKPLRRLLERCDGIDQLVPNGDPLPPFDFWTPLLSIPGILRTTLDTIPGECGYIHPDAGLVAEWRRRLNEYTGFRIGIAWQGSPDFHADRQRSVPLKHFAELAKLSGVRLISLQKGPGTDQIKQLNHDFDLVHFGDELDSTSGPFMDSAAIMSIVDLIITSDTSVPHLAGAIGSQVWMGLSISPDWRWLLEREQSPWYPSMRLFRQQKLGDWQEVFQRIAAALEERLAIQITSTEVPSSATDLAARQESLRVPLLASDFNTLMRTRHGVMLFNRNDIYIGRSLELYGEFSAEEIDLICQFVRPNDVVVEAGANIGTHTVPLAQAVGSQGLVYAFEPQRVVFQTLCANVSLNSLSNVICRQQAVGAAAGEIVVPLLDARATLNFGGLGLGTYQRGERVPVATIDDLALPACRLMKIDVEGMEIDVLKGAAETIQRLKPVLYVENDRADLSSHLIEHLQLLGYRLYWHTPRLFRAANFFGNQENAFANIVSVNMLCLPESVETPDAISKNLRPITNSQSRWNEVSR
jgi:FkbM family methyltransferase